MLTILSSLDDRARPKGSRDPLGIEAVWSYMGRKVVGNLTTVTGNLENFIVALLCCHHANEQADDLEIIQDHYMRAEQLAAYLKLTADSGEFLGITRAKKNFHKDDIVLGKSQRAQLLSDQLSYGLWGLYSSALEGAGLTTGARRQITATGAKVVQNIIATLGIEHWELFQRLAAQGSLTRASITTLGMAFIKALKQPVLRKAVVDALLATQKDCVLQSELYGLAQTYLSAGGTASARPFCAWVLAQPQPSAAMKEALTRIQDLEPLLVLGETLMAWLQRESRQSAAFLHSQLAPRLNGVTHMQSWAKEARLPHRLFLQSLLAALNQSDADCVISTIVKQNKDVMHQRGGAPWIEFDHQRQLTVRVQNNSADLPADLAVHGKNWKNTYFLGSFLHITKQGMA